MSGCGTSACGSCPVASATLERLGIDAEGVDHVVALAGNPNTGKSTIFNRLTGLRQHTGNWPGKTITRAEGGYSYEDRRYKLVDLPGTYSLLSASPDEEVARDFILFGRPDVTLVVVDATALERNLNLTLQILKISEHVVVCLIDEADRLRWTLPRGFHDKMVDGMYLTTAWVASVMLPPMAIFFPLFTILKDLGYLPRVAFNLDRVFQSVGAHGKQALTMSMGFGCNAAGVVAARVIDSPRERLIAIITNNFSLCNGRWPTQILIAGVFVGALVPAALSGLVAAGTVFGVAALGVVLTFGTYWLLSRTVLRGQALSFSLELPPYRPPRILNTLYTSFAGLLAVSQPVLDDHIHDLQGDPQLEVDGGGDVFAVGHRGAVVWVAGMGAGDALRKWEVGARGRGAQGAHGILAQGTALGMDGMNGTAG